MTIFVDKVQGPRDDDDLWQVLASFRLQKFVMPRSNNIVETAPGVFGTNGTLRVVVDGYERDLNSPDAWDFSSSGVVPEGQARVYLLIYVGGPNFPLALPVDVIDNPEGLSAEELLQNLGSPPLFEFTQGISCCGVLVIPNGVDPATELMTSRGTLFQGFPPGYFVGMSNRRFARSDWVDLHQN